VEKATAIYVAKTIVDATIGRGLDNQAITAFKMDQPTVGDVVSVLERLCGGPRGWKILQSKAGYTSST